MHEEQEEPKLLKVKLPAAATSPDQYSKVAKRDVTAVRSLAIKIYILQSGTENFI